MAACLFIPREENPGSLPGTRYGGSPGVAVLSPFSETPLYRMQSVAPVAPLIVASVCLPLARPIGECEYECEYERDCE
jgi:hypothetical protein